MSLSTECAAAFLSVRYPSFYSYKCVCICVYMYIRGNQAIAYQGGACQTRKIDVCVPRRPDGGASLSSHHNLHRIAHNQIYKPELLA